MGSKLDRLDTSDHGQSLVEVVAALALLIVVLVPALLLVTRSTTVVYSNQYKLVAANLASDQLEVVRNQVVSLAALPPVAPTSPVTVGAATYAITQVSGWCTSPITSGGLWNPAGGTSYGYGVVVTVTWKSNKTGVRVAGLLSTPGGTSFAPPPSTTSCPL